MYLYRKWRQAVTLLVLSVALLTSALVAQWRAPRPERKTPRAVAVLESYAGGAQRLVPITLFYERRYYDAAYYRASPVPFTISPETVYEVERFGKPLGTFTVWNATRSAEGAWAGTGVFRGAPDAAMLAMKKKAAAPVRVEDPSRPVLHRREGSEGDRPVAAKPQAGEDDAERPKLHRREEVPANATPQPAQQASRSAVGAADASVEAPPAGESDHPILRRGKPAQAQGGRDLPAPAGAAGAKNPEHVVRQAGPSEPQELLFTLTEAQRLQMQESARQLARAELLRLAPMRGLSLPAAPASAKESAPPLPELTSLGLTSEDEQFAPYDLDYNDYATVVFSARYRSQSAGREHSWVVLVIARQDGDKLVKLYSAVSDPRELDLYPELRLVDAVDPDGYGRYALLFREQKRDGVSWLLGRVSGYELQTLFETAAR